MTSKGSFFILNILPRISLSVGKTSVKEPVTSSVPVRTTVVPPSTLEGYPVPSFMKVRQYFGLTLSFYRQFRYKEFVCTDRYVPRKHVINITIMYFVLPLTQSKSTSLKWTIEKR